MACSLTSGRKDATCKDKVGGLKNVYLFDYSDTLYSNLNITAGIITSVDVSETISMYKYELQGSGNSFEEAGEVSRENGTSLNNQTLTIALKTQDGATKEEFDTLAKGRPHVVIEDYNGDFKLAGAEFGLDVAINTTSGGAMADFNGYNITFTGQERVLAPFIASDKVGAGQDFDVQSTQIDPNA